MGELIYKKKVKIALIIFQVIAAGIMTFCFLNIGFWMEDSYSLREMSRDYEETDLFFKQVNVILEHKIRGQQNQTLFETEGKFDGKKEIDIQAYTSLGSVKSNAVRDMNTTYLLEDLLEFAERGDCDRLHAAILSAMEQQTAGSIAGEILDARASELESITPVTGISIAECSRWYSNSADYILEMYTKLDEATQDLYSRYLEYTTRQDESWSYKAPGNLKYCIYNTATGEIYTNSGKRNYTSAVRAIEKDPDYECLYEGERSFNIMVTNTEKVMNQAAANWFMQNRLVGTNEKVYIAVNRSYPVGDELQNYSNVFAHRENMVWGSLGIFIICGVLLIGALIASLMAAGWSEGRCTPEQTVLDRIPTELAFGLYMVIAVLLMLFFEWIPAPENLFMRDRMLIAAIASVSYLIFLSAGLTLVRRIRTKTLWSNSISLMLIRTWSQVTSSRKASGWFLILYIVFAILNFVFIGMGKIGFFLALALDLVVLLFLLRDMVGKRSIYEGIHQISKGDFKYKIDTSSLQGETHEMAKAINEMGDDLQKAVDAIVKNERLKAELITNVSHDIKTPLTSIVNYVDLLKRENLEGERVQKYIEILEQKSQRLRQLTEDLVEASKITSGNIELQFMRIPLQGMLQQAYGEFQERFEEHRLSVVWEVEKDPAYIMADGRQLWRILENLLGNIYKYALEGTRVYVELHREDRTVYLTLKNTSREELTMQGEELTGRFVRGDRSRNTEGSGLGLSIAQSLMQLHGGTFQITVEDDQFTASISFPVAVEEES